MLKYMVLRKGIDMNEWNRGNLNFILTSTDADMEDFLSWASDEDLAYALELIRLARAELELEEILMLELDKDPDTSQAQAILKRFRL
jgi:hypothetical protein